MQWIDIHTHKDSIEDSNHFRIYNVDLLNASLIHQKDFFSLGIHPWFIDNWEKQFTILTSQIEDCIAVGECGLDKVCPTDWQLQIEIFQRQIELAEQKQKPIIIHCVKAYAEVLDCVKEATVPIVFHGFNKSEQIAAQILRKSNHYLSFGKSIFQSNNHSASVLKKIPADRYFLETDDSHLKIEEIYQQAAQIRKISEEMVSLQIITNFKRAFIDDERY